MSTFVHSDAIGVVVEFKRKGNFGFIRPSDMSDPCLDDIDDVFFHISDVPNRSIEPGDEVWFDLHLGPKGYFAKDITFQTSDDEDSVSDSEEYFLEEGVQGVVTQYRERSRYGFIYVNDTYNKVFFHISKVEGEDIEVGDKVELDLYLGPKGYFAEGITFPTSDDEDFVESESDSEELIQNGVQGVVTRYGTKSRYGFIRVNDTFNKVFFHISEVSGDYIEVGDEVEFDLCVGPKGYFAETIEVLNLESGDDDSDSESDADDETANEETLLASNASGVVKRYLNRRRFGFIKSDHGDMTYNKIFFHISAVLYQPVAIHDTVQFDLYVGPKGYFAKSVTFNSPTRVDTDCTEIGLGQNVGSLGGYNLLQGTEKKNDHKESTANDSSCAGSTGTTNFETSRISREKGNAFFKQAREHDSGKSKMAYYLNALECYKKAYTSSSKDEDLVSAAKNTGTTCWKLAKLKMEENSSELKVVHAYFKDTLQYFKIAQVKRSCMVDEWSNHLEKSIKECLSDIRAWVAPRNDQERIRVLKEFVDYMPESGAKVSCYLHIANIYFRNGKDAIKEREYNGCLRYMDDCAATLKEARKSCSDVDPSFEVNITDLEKDIHHQKDVAQKCLAKVKEAQERQTQRKEEAKERENAKIQLKADLKKLEGFKKLTLPKFIERVYKQWPPKGVDKSKLRSPSSASSKSSTRRLLIHAIAFYHPDKVDKKKHGVKWHVLCDEITKCLNALLADVNT